MATNYNPQTDSAFAVNKPIATVGVVLDRRSEYPDETNFLSRAFVSTTEAKSYYNTSFKRDGKFSVFINDTGVLQSDGTILGGIVKEYWWRDGTADADLILKVSGGGDIAPSSSQEFVI